MIITYFRSSSYNRWDFCQSCYFYEYALGLRGDSNKAADKGTIVHKILELLAWSKKINQDNIESYKDDETGITVSADYDLIDVDELIEKVYKYYSLNIKIHEWKDIDFKDCKKWTHMALNHEGGAFDPRLRTIVQPEMHFDFEINEPWAKYEYEVDGEKISGNLALKGTIDLITDCGDGVYEIIDWKGLPLDTKIPTPYGFTTMGKISVGDLVFDQNGKQCKVIGKSKIKTKNCFKIIFDDKTSVTCDDEHLWKLSNGDTVPITDLKVGDKINVAQPIECDYAFLPIDPYVLGAWLGDGRNRSCEITSNDREVFSLIYDHGYHVGENLEKRNRKAESRTIYSVTKELRKLGLLNNKHIPEIYLRASYEQRLQLLMGLMDTDGNVNSFRKQCVFTTCNKRLSDDVKELLLTLGQRPNQSIVKRDTNFKKNITVYPIAFRPIDLVPFSLNRKAKQIKDWGHGRSSVRKIISIKNSIVQNTQCISVDSFDNTYLCTENFIPTHNTGQRKCWTTGEEKSYSKLMTDPQLRLYYYAAKTLFPDKEILFTINFIRFGGPFTLGYSDKDIDEFKKLLRHRFAIIQNNQKPDKIDQSHKWKCNRLCHFGKNTFQDTDITPIQEFRKGQVCRPGETMTMCEQIHYDLKTIGYEKTVKKYKDKNFVIGKYHAPGQTT